MMLPTAVEPVKETFFTSGCLQRASESRGVFFVDVVMTLNTPGAKPASVASLANIRVVRGVSGDGLAMIVHPAARAAPTLRRIILSSVRSATGNN